MSTSTGMHRSRLAGFIIDCETADLGSATKFWAEALGMRMGEVNSPGYKNLEAGALGLTIEVQQVSHPSRVHLDIETDHVEAEVARLERLGATRVGQVKTWWVMQAPTGQRFCVVKAKELDGRAGVTSWD